MKKEKGFTLIELVIVVVIIGVLATIMFKVFGGGVSDTAKAQALYSTTQKLNQSWMILNMNSGTSSQLNTANVHPLVNNAALLGGKGALEILAQGVNAVAATYQSTYINSAIVPINFLTGSNGVYSVYGYNLVMKSYDPYRTSYTFSAVPDPIIASLVLKYGVQSDVVNGVLTPLFSNNTSAVIIFPVGNPNGKRDLTISVY